MPLPIYQPVRKKSKVDVRWSLDDLDDYCLSKIIGHALSLSSLRDDELSTVGDNGKTEKNLSLVSKRWYFLTQTQVGIHGVHKINLDKISKGGTGSSVGKGGGGGGGVAPKATSHGSRIACVPITRRPGVLMQKNTFGASSLTTNHHNHLQTGITRNNETCNITLFRSIQPKLLKYKHIQIEGSLSCDEFKKLILALNAARIEQLNLKIKVDKDRTQVKEFAIIPKQLCNLERLTLFWYNDPKNEYSNGLTWTIYERANKLKTLEIHLNEEISGNNESKLNNMKNRRSSIEKISSKCLDQRPCGNLTHYNLGKIVFNRTSSNHSSNCGYTALIKSVLLKEDSVFRVDTNDNMLIEHLIKSSDRICTTHELRFLKFLSPIKSLDLLSQLLRSRNLGTDHLSIVIDTTDQLDEVRLSMENFKSTRHDVAVCQLSLYMKDQKFPDCEEKIKNLVYLSRLAEMVIYMSAQQRVSIDCCHLMWSVGRALQSSDGPGKCLFKISLQPIQLKNNSNNFSEITVPFGKCQQYKINSNREDLARHREIMKSLKRDCYHQFVKSVRDNVTP